MPIFHRRKSSKPDTAQTDRVQPSDWNEEHDFTGIGMPLARDGDQGPPGPFGPPGQRGPQGLQGRPGSPGSPMLAAPQGEPGAIGPPGPQGNIGATGRQGAPGAANIPLLLPTEGEIGPSGPPGPQGNIGATGAAPTNTGYTRPNSSATPLIDASVATTCQNTPATGTESGAPVNNGDGTYTITVTAFSAAEMSSLIPNMVLRNTTKGTKARITSVHRTATTTITVAQNQPGDVSAWQNGDALTTASATNTGRAGVFVDFDVTAPLQTSAIGIILLLQCQMTTAAAGRFIILHPYATYAASAELLVLQAINTTAQWSYLQGLIAVVWETSRAYITLAVLGSTADTFALGLQYAGEVDHS